MRPEDIAVGDKKAEITTEKGGRVLWINNEDVANIAKEAGAPKEKGAGVVLRTKLGDNVKKSGTLIDIYAERNVKLEAAIELAKRLHPIGLSEKPEERMLIDRIPPQTIQRKPFILER